MRIPFEVMHEKHDPIVIGQFVDRPWEAGTKIRLGRGARRTGDTLVNQLVAEALLIRLDSPKCHRHGNPVQPAGESSLPPELDQSLECPDKGLLRKIGRESLITHHPVDQSKDPVYVGVIELLKCALLAT